MKEERMNGLHTAIRIGSLICGLYVGHGVLAAEWPPDIGNTLAEPKPSARHSDPDGYVDTAHEALRTSDGARFHVSSVQISGSTAFTDLELLPLVNDVAGQDVTLADLEAAAARITQFYRANGFPVARAYVPAQRIERGNLQFAVMEGHYGALDVHNDSQLSDAFVRGTLRAVNPDDLIETASLDRQVLLLQDLAGASVTARLTPGDRLGTSDLVVNIDGAPPFSGTFETDNFGNRYTGELRAGGSVAATNLAGRGDVLSVRGLVSEDSGLWYGRASYLIPVTTGGLRAGGAVSRTHYSLGDRFSSLDADGEANIFSMMMQYPLLRSMRANLEVRAALNYFDLNDEIQATDTSDPRSVSSMTLTLTGDLDDGLFGGGWNAAALTIGSGSLQIDDDVATAIDRATVRAEGDFEVLAYSLMRRQHITDTVQLYVSVLGQYASRNLDPSQKFVLGGPNAVRAYGQGVGIGDQGVLGTAELRYQLPSGQWFSAPTAFAFIDSGTIDVNHDPFLSGDNSVDLSGAGVGLHFDMAFGITVRGSIAWPIGSSSGIDSSGSQGWLQVIKTL
jgi:hemolysin activation/secretion protein